MRKPPISLFFDFAAATAAAIVFSASAVADDVSVRHLQTPAPSNSSLSRVVADESGRIFLSWVSRNEETASLVFSRLTEDKWSEPQTVHQGGDWFVNWADFPMLSVNQGNMTAHWLKMSGEGRYDYDIEAKFYNAEQQEWSDPRIIHDDGVSAEHGFVSMLPMEAGRTFISWLDGRNTRSGDSHGAMTLRAGVFDSTGLTIDGWELDSRVCECCQTDSAMTAAGPIVVYRDRSDEEIRDIYSTRYVDGAWTAPQPVHNDDWRVAGCPVNGPAVAARGDRVAVSWFTARDDTPEVRLALSGDGGISFSEPVPVGGPDTIGRVGVAILNSGRVIVSWLDTERESARIVLSLFSRDGGFIGRTEVAETSASRRSGFPVIVEKGESVYVTWTDIGEAPQVKVARVDF